MDSDQRKWHLSKEIPLALIATILLGFFSGGVAYQSLKGDIERNAESTAGVQTAVRELRDEMRSVVQKMGDSRLPSEQNSWRISQAEATQAELKLRVTELERSAAARESRVQRLENNLGSTQARLRARDER